MIQTVCKQMKIHPICSCICIRCEAAFIAILCLLEEAAMRWIYDRLNFFIRGCHMLLNPGILLRTVKNFRNSSEQIIHFFSFVWHSKIMSVVPKWGKFPNSSILHHQSRFPWVGKFVNVLSATGQTEFKVCPMEAYVFLKSLMHAVLIMEYTRQIFAHEIRVYCKMRHWDIIFKILSPTEKCFKLT